MARNLFNFLNFKISSYPFDLFDERARWHGVDSHKMFTQTRFMGDFDTVRYHPRGEGYLVATVGQDERGILRNTDLLGSHMLVAGQTQSGKTRFMYQFLLSLLYYNHPEYLRVVLVDPEKDMFAPFQKVCTVINDGQEAMDMVVKLAEICESRKRDSSFREIRSHWDHVYSSRNRDALKPAIVMVFDEFGDFYNVHKDNTAFAEAIQWLGAKSASFGVSICLMTQGSYVSMIPGPLQLNLRKRYCFRFDLSTSYQQILDVSFQMNDTSDFNLSPGDFFVKDFNIPARRLHSLLCTDKCVSECIGQLHAGGWDYSLK